MWVLTPFWLICCRQDSKEISVIMYVPSALPSCCLSQEYKDIRNRYLLMIFWFLLQLMKNIRAFCFFLFLNNSIPILPAANCSLGHVGHTVLWGLLDDFLRYLVCTSQFLLCSKPSGEVGMRGEIYVIQSV